MVLLYRKVITRVVAAQLVSCVFTPFAREITDFSQQKDVRLAVQLDYVQMNTVLLCLFPLLPDHSVNSGTLCPSLPPSMWPLSQGTPLATGQVRHGCRGVQENGISSEERQHLSQGPAGATAKKLLALKYSLFYNKYSTNF